MCATVTLDAILRCSTGDEKKDTVTLTVEATLKGSIDGSVPPGWATVSVFSTREGGNWWLEMSRVPQSKNENPGEGTRRQDKDSAEPKREK